MHIETTFIFSRSRRRSLQKQPGVRDEHAHRNRFQVNPGAERDVHIWHRDERNILRVLHPEEPYERPENTAVQNEVTIGLQNVR